MNKIQQENHSVMINGVTAYADYTNKRMKILDCELITGDIINYAIDFSKDQELDKIISNCCIERLNIFKDCGFTIEGTINGFFKGRDAYCVSLFINPERQITLKKQEEDTILLHCVNNGMRLSTQKKHDYRIRPANVNDIPQMIQLFSSVFETYPTPLSTEYFKNAMRNRVLFRVADTHGEIISIASADMDQSNLNAEITDCATCPKYRGFGILSSLIPTLETELMGKGFQTVYSLARAINPGINKALSSLSYKHCGTLINNCHICGEFEDMNIWVKTLTDNK